MMGRRNLIMKNKIIDFLISWFGNTVAILAVTMFAVAVMLSVALPIIILCQSKILEAAGWVVLLSIGWGLFLALPNPRNKS